MSTFKSIGTSRTLLAAGVAVLGLAMSTGQLTAAGGAGTGDQSVLDAAMAGQTGTTQTVLYADSSPDVFARAASARDAFGFPVGAQRVGRRVHDGPQKSDYDEVSEVDSAGQVVAMTQFDSNGRLLTAVRFDKPSSSTANVTQDGAAKSARRGMTAYGVQLGTQTRTDVDAASGGWNLHWDRFEGGFPVRGDETAVHVWQDGRIQSVARVEHQLAAAPTRRLSQADAQTAVARQMDAWFAGKDAGYSAQGSDLQWVAPNAAFDPSKVSAAAGPYRLAWVANVKPSGPAADSIRLITLYVDAGDGTILGGDVVE